MKKNKSCLKIRGIKQQNKEISCFNCGFKTVAANGLTGHVCRPESIYMFNQIKLLNTNIDKLNDNIKGNQLDYKDNIDNKNDEILKLTKKIEKYDVKYEAKYEAKIEKLKNDIFNLEHNNSLIIDELKEYKNKIFDIASKPSIVNNKTEYYREPSTIVIEEIDDLDDF